MSRTRKESAGGRVDEARSRIRDARRLFEYARPVRLIDWGRLSGSYAAVLLTAAAAVLSFITGMSHLSRETATLAGPLAPYLPPGFAGVHRILGVVVGFSLVAVAIGLQRRNRLAWYTALVLLPVASLQALITARAIDVPVLLLPAIALPVVIYNRDRFDQRIDLSTIQLAALSSLAAVQIYGTVGTYVLRSEFTGIETLTDAFYYIVVTGTTVGYGDATPVTPSAKLFTLSILITGTAAFGAAFGSLVVPVIEAQMAGVLGKMTASELTLLEEHVLVLGYGELTEPLLDELEASTDYVVLTDDTARASELSERGVNVLTADPSDEEKLREAGIDRASGVIAATGDDASDALAVLAANELNPDVRIVAAATEPQNVGKLKGAGADRVISTAVIGGYLLGRSVVGEADAEDLPDRLVEDRE